jgi:hypothetical protein
MFKDTTTSHEKAGKKRLAGCDAIRPCFTAADSVVDL